MAVGNVRPVALFDGEPVSLIFDPNTFILDHDTDLDPFSPIVFVTNTQAHYDIEKGRQNREHVIIAVLSQLNVDGVQNFLLAHPQGNFTIHSYHLHFPGGQQYDTNKQWQREHASQPITCYSITNRLLWNIRAACSSTCQLNITYCDRRARQSEHVGEISAAFAYTTQMYNRLRLQTIYNQQLSAFMDQQR